MASEKWLRDHRQVKVYLTTHEVERLAGVVARYGYSVSNWLRRKIDEEDCARLPESQGAVKKIVSKDVATAACEAIINAAEVRRIYAERIWKKKKDWREREELREEARQMEEAASWFLEVIEEHDLRETLLETGAVKARHRTKEEEATG